jgi:uncharacterized membrane protein YkoI
MSRRISLALASAVLLVAASSLAAQDVKLKEEKPGLLKRAKVTFEQAKATAQAKVPSGKLDSAELEEEDGKLIFSLGYTTAGKSGVDEVNVDAITGKVVGMSHETPADEAKEAKAKKAAPKKP